MANLSDIPEQPDLDLEKTERQAVLTGLLAKLDDYVFPEVAATLQARLNERWKQGRYDALTSAIQLAEVLTTQMQELSRDQNLRLFYSAEPLPHLDARQEPTPEEWEHQRHLSSLRNFDFNRVERLSGNVGYLELFGFEAPELAGEVAIAAMQFLSHTAALIIDLRYNSGGSPAMVALLCSYLFPAYPPVHLNDLYWRPQDEWQQSWTLPYVPGQRYLNKPVYILTSQETFSAAEEFTYNLRVLKRATVVGEPTRGGANLGSGHRLTDHFWMFVPTGRPVNPTTGENWEGTGIVPDVKVPAELAPKTAHLMALEHLLEHEADHPLRKEWQQTMLRLQTELNEMRQELISKLRVRR